MKHYFIYRYIRFAFCLAVAAASAQNAVTPGLVYTESSLVNIGVNWSIAGDDDLDARCSIRFRRTGETSWRPGLDLMRTHTNLYGYANDRPDNRFAGSVFFLEREAAYELELTLIDPDGGSATTTVTASTFTPLSPCTNGPRYWVAPGSGGGSGSSTNPFLGLDAAVRHATPGAIFEVTAGLYAPFTCLASGRPDQPIVFRGAVDPLIVTNENLWAIVDGADTLRGVCTLGQYDQVISNIMIQGMVLQNGYWGVDAQNARNIVFCRNIVRDVGFGYYNRRNNGWDGCQLLCDNVLIGRTAWPGSGIPSERGIDLRGSGNMVCYNRVSNFGDGISLQPLASQAWGNDIYGNDIFYIVDDLIEIDYNMANTRVWRNRVCNGRMGISVAPIHGGPVYIFRNIFFNLESSAYKMNNQPGGLFIAHNTSLKQGNGTSSPSGWQNTFLRNNFIYGTRYVMEEYGLIDGSRDDWDYDALGTPQTPFAKWDNVRYNTITDLRVDSGIEFNAVEISPDDLLNAPLPAAYTNGVTPGGYDLRLQTNAAAIDAGQPLVNINDPFVFDGQPDCGAYEAGAPLHPYGPRTHSVSLAVRAFYRAGSHVLSEWEGETGVPYQLQDRTNLMGGVWHDTDQRATAATNLLRWSTVPQQTPGFFRVRRLY